MQQGTAAPQSLYCVGADGTVARRFLELCAVGALLFPVPCGRKIPAGGAAAKNPVGGAAHCRSDHRVFLLDHLPLP